MDIEQKSDLNKPVTTKRAVKRSLYECSHAKVNGDRIHCAKGHRLGGVKDGDIGIRRLTKGEPLQYSICQKCADFDSMGPPIPKEERGWVDL